MAVRLTDRQETVLRALVGAYVGSAAPVGSALLSHTLAIKLSPASIRNTMAELGELGLIEQPHTSAGRVPTEAGLRRFVDDLLDPQDVDEWERRRLALELGDVGSDASLRVASELLSRCTHQLGFAVLPRLDRVGIRHASLIRVSSERVLVVLVSQAGVTYQRVLRDRESGDQRRLDRLAGELNRRLGGRTLPEVRRLLEQETGRLRRRADLLLRGLLAAVRELTGEAARGAELLLASPVPLLDHPEFHDPERARELLEALETRETLRAFVDRVLERPGVAVTFAGEVELPVLRDCAVVSAACGAGGPLGRVGVLGPSRMDYARVIPRVDLLSQLVTEKLSA